MRLAWLLAASLLLTTAASPAFAYIGPGAGVTMLGALWAVLVAVVLAVAAVVFYPVRVLMRRFRKPTPETRETTGAGTAAGEPGR